MTFGQRRENGWKLEGVCPIADCLSDCGSLFHVSEQGDVRVFHPRPFSTAPNAGPVVWAIDALKLPNYLLPRDCPRVTFGASAATTVEDRQQFGVGKGRVVVSETGWLRRVCEGCLHVYDMPMSGFRLIDESAGYWPPGTRNSLLRALAAARLPRGLRG